MTFLYKDEYFVAINKPNGLLVHRSYIASDASEFALQLVRDAIGQYVYPVHRLDRKTSGVLIFGLSSVYFLKSDKYILSSICYFLAYFYDCADGKMARKYNMTSKYGDLYDHVSDLIKHILLFYVLYYNM